MHHTTPTARSPGLAPSSSACPLFARVRGRLPRLPSTQLCRELEDEVSNLVLSSSDQGKRWTTFGTASPASQEEKHKPRPDLEKLHQEMLKKKVLWPSPSPVKAPNSRNALVWRTAEGWPPRAEWPDPEEPPPGSGGDGQAHRGSRPRRLGEAAKGLSTEPRGC